MDRQTEILELLMKLQKEEMKQLREWMTMTEDRISRMGSLGSTIDEVQIQIEDHTALQDDLEKQQVNIII